MIVTPDLSSTVFCSAGVPPAVGWASRPPKADEQGKLVDTHLVRIAKAGVSARFCSAVVSPAVGWASRPPKADEQEKLNATHFSKPRVSGVLEMHSGGQDARRTAGGTPALQNSALQNPLQAEPAHLMSGLPQCPRFG